MGQEQVGVEHIELTREISFPGDISFDTDKICLQGRYGDQLSLHRARKIWNETLESCFLLEGGHDFQISLRSNHQEGDYVMNCVFVSACGRYAFWRLTNQQAPEAQYMLETAHIPNSDINTDQYLAASDMRSVLDTELQRAEKINTDAGIIIKLVNMLKRLASS